MRSAAKDCKDYLSTFGLFGLPPLATLMDLVAAVLLLIHNASSRSDSLPDCRPQLLEASGIIALICAITALVWVHFLLFLCLHMANTKENDNFNICRRIIESPLKFALYTLRGAVGVLALVRVILVFTAGDECISEVKQSKHFGLFMAGNIMLILSTGMEVAFVRIYAWLPTTYSLYDDVKLISLVMVPLFIFVFKLAGGIMVLAVAGRGGLPNDSGDALYASTGGTKVFIRWGGAIVKSDSTSTPYPLPECLIDGLAAIRIMGIVSGSLALPVACIMLTMVCCWDRFKASVLRFVLCSFGWLDGVFALIAIILLKTTSCGDSDDCSLPLNTCFSQYDKESPFHEFVVGGSLVVTSSLLSIPYLLLNLTTTCDNNNDDMDLNIAPAGNTNNTLQEMLVIPPSPTIGNLKSWRKVVILEDKNDDVDLTQRDSDKVERDDFECGICYLTYTTDPVRRPCICPSCGNTLCHACVLRITACIFCRAPMDPSRVVPNIAIVQMLGKPHGDDMGAPGQAALPRVQDSE